jgi:hypothetical protein
MRLSVAAVWRGDKLSLLRSNLPSRQFALCQLAKSGNQLLKRLVAESSGVIAATFYNIGATPGLPVTTVALGVAIWLAAAGALHLAARHILGGLLE